MKKYVNTILSVMLLVSMAFGMFGCSEKAGVVDPQMYDKAVSAMESGNYEEAYDLFIKLDPDYQDVKEYLSHFYFVPVSGSMESVTLFKKTVQSSTEITYNENGLPITIVQKDGNGQEQSPHRLEYDAKGRVIVDSSESGGEVYNKEYTYNELDQLVRMSERGVVTENTFDEKGNKVKSVTTYSSGDVRTTVYSYDEFGRLISSESEYESYNYSYDEAGNLVREEKVYDDNATVRICEYDSEGRLVKEKFDGSAINSREYVYDKNGNLCKDIISYEEHGIQTLKTVFNTNGRPMKRRYIDFYGKGYTYRFRYDKYGCMNNCIFDFNKSLDFEYRRYKLEYKLVYIPYDEIPSEALRIINIMDSFV